MSEPEFIAVCKADEIAPGQTGDFEVGEHSVLVANCDGTYYAIEDRCTHDDGPLAQGRLRRCEIECPRHGAKFDMRTGKATALPAFNAVSSFPCRVNPEGFVEVNVNVEPAGPRFEDPRGTFKY